jgi:hypothetical protein
LADDFVRVSSDVEAAMAFVEPERSVGVAIP